MSSNRTLPSSSPDAAPAATATPVAFPSAARTGQQGRRRAVLWAALFALVAMALGALLWLTWEYETGRSQEEAESAAVAAAADVRQVLSTDEQSLQALVWNDPDPKAWTNLARGLLRSRPEIVRIELRRADFSVEGVQTSPYRPTAFEVLDRGSLDSDASAACDTARRLSQPTFSRSYFVPLGGGLGVEVTDLCVMRQVGGSAKGWQVATIALVDVLERAVPQGLAARHEITFVEADGTRLARAGLRRGAGVYQSERLLDLPGLTLILRADSSSKRPKLIPTVTSTLVLGLALALGGVLFVLARDVGRRAEAERQVADALAFRKAMEDSLVTGLRARDMQGRITYVNPAFCELVGLPAEELLGRNPPPYWPPEHLETYTRRQAGRMAGDEPPREGFETVFMHRDGRRIPVRIFEAPLVDNSGERTGWMSAVVDVSEQRRAEELSRQQQDKLQAAARLATMGEMASLLSHELNQPLAAIASYANGSLNLLEQVDSDPAAAHEDIGSIRQALRRVAEQADRAGRVIRSVHDFVRRREQQRERVRCDALIDGVLPLVRLAAQKTHTRIEVEFGEPGLAVHCDRTMVEQVLLNLARNGLQAMGESTPVEQRVLTLRANRADDRWIALSVIDRGPGIAPDVAARLFTPFFSTRPDGMGMGLNLCRTVIEQHGGELRHSGLGSDLAAGTGTEFRFTLPAAK